MLATRSDLFVPTIVDAPFHVMTNLLQEFKDVFPTETPEDCHL
jgi:hypothetical protein